MLLDGGAPTIPIHDRRPILVVGCGSPLRRDEGAGPAVAERVRAAVADLDGARILVRGQLTPELTRELAGARHAVFVDASAMVPPGEIEVSAGGRSGSARSAGPGGGDRVALLELLALARDLYGSAPPVTLVAIGATDLGPGEGLSAGMDAAIERAAELVTRLVVELGAAGGPVPRDTAPATRPAPGIAPARASD